MLLRSRVTAIAVFGLAGTGCGRIAFEPLTEDGGGDAAVTDLGGGCPPSYTAAGTSCYRLVLNPPTEPAWLAAELDCEADAVGAHLFVPDDIVEVSLLISMLGPVADVHIGVSDEVNEGTYLTVTGQPLAYTMWASGEPDGISTQNCLFLRDDTLLRDNACSMTNDYACEYDGIAAVPAAYTP